MGRKSGSSAGALTLAALVGLAVAIPTDVSVSRERRDRIAPGIYGNVGYSSESGDLSGVEIEIDRLRAGEVETTFCEGWCNSLHRSTYQERGGVIQYVVREKLTDTNGGEVIEVFPVRLRPSGKNVVMDAGDFMRAKVMKRLPKRYGLEVADEVAASQL